jgi:hypothetical protein
MEVGNHERNGEMGHFFDRQEEGANSGAPAMACSALSISDGSGMMRLIRLRLNGSIRGTEEDEDEVEDEDEDEDEEPSWQQRKSGEEGGRGRGLREDGRHREEGEGR